MLRFLALVLACTACGEASRGGASSADGGDGAGGNASGSGGRAGGPDAATAQSSERVVDAAWLSARLADTTIQLVDARAEYPGGHISGALAIRPESLVAADAPFIGMIAPAAEAEQTLGQAGLRNGTTVVVYGDSPEYDPARVTWALRYYRHGDVRYLDGGFTAWVAAGGQVTSGAPAPAAPSAYTLASVDASIIVTGDWLRAELGQAPYDDVAIQIVDARSTAEYTAAHVPGARHIEWTRNFTDGSLISTAGTPASSPYAALDPDVTTITYCLVGWRASVAWLTLTELGFRDVRVYDGSWAEWGQGGFPVE